MSVAVDDAALGRFTRDLDAVAPEASVAVERLRQVQSTGLPNGMHVAGRRVR